MSTKVFLVKNIECFPPNGKKGRRILKINSRVNNAKQITKASRINILAGIANRKAKISNSISLFTF